MYSIRFLFLIFFGTMLFSSCGENPEKEKQKTKNDSAIVDVVPDSLMQYVRGFDYSIQVGPRLSMTEALVPGAILQYQDYENELYIVVKEETKTEFDSIAHREKSYDETKSPLKNFAAIKLAATKKTMAMKAEPGQTAGEISGMKSEIVAFSGKPEGMDLDVFYKVAFIDFGDKFYTVTIWTVDNYKSKNLAMMDRMLFSFRKEEPVLSK